VLHLLLLLVCKLQQVLADDDDDDDDASASIAQQWAAGFAWKSLAVPFLLSVICLILVGIFRIALPHIYEPRQWKAMPHIESAVPPLSRNPFFALVDVVLRPLWQVSEMVGLDAFAFLSSGRALLYVNFLFIVIGIPLTFPLYCTGDHWKEISGFDEVDELSMLGICSILNVPGDSNRVSIAVVATYVYTLILVVALLGNLAHVQHMKRKYQRQRRPARYYTVQVNAIPEGEREPWQVQQFFEERHYQVEGVCPIKHMNQDYHTTVKRFETAFRHLHHWEAKERKALAKGKLVPLQVRLPWPRWCEKVDAVEHHKSDYVGFRQQLEEYRQEYQGLEDSDRAFVTFKTLTDARTAIDDFTYGDIEGRLKRWIRPAPEPRDIYWWSLENAMAGLGWRVGTLMWLIWSTLATVFIFIVPIVAIQFLRNWNYERVADEADQGSDDIILGFLPSIFLVITNWIASYVLYFLALYSGLSSHHLVQDAWMWQYFIYLIVDAFIITFFASALATAFRHGNPRDVHNPWETLGTALPASAAFFYTFTGTQAFTALLPRAALPANLFKALWRRAWHLTSWELELAMAPNFPKYAKMYARDTFIFAITFTFGVLAPGLLLISFVYFMLSHLVFKYKLTYQYRSRFQAEGKLALPAARQVLVGVIVAQVCIMAVVATKRASLLFAILPLPILLIVLIFFLPWLYMPLKDHGLAEDLAEEFDADTSEVQQRSKADSLMAIRNCDWMQPSLQVDLDKPLPQRFFWQYAEQWEKPTDARDFLMSDGETTDEEKSYNSLLNEDTESGME